jgi:hypothetical protein
MRECLTHWSGAVCGGLAGCTSSSSRRAPSPMVRANGQDVLMQGDTWTRGYSRTHPRLPACEVCGHVEVPPVMDHGGWYQHRGWLVWDHCHDHLIVRGTLCVGCNNDEATDLRNHFAGDRFTQWRKRCPPCNSQG